MRNHLISLFLSFMYESSITDPYRLSLEATSAKWFRGVWISGFVVALGCALETWEVAFNLKNWWRARKRRDLLQDNPGSWRHLLAALGLFLVVGGIVGETIFEVLDSNVESQLRTHASDLISDADQKTAIADGEAGDAETKAAQIQKEAEDEQVKRVKLEIELAKLKAPRVLTQAQQSELVKELKPFSGTPITINFEFTDGEAKALGEQLWVVLNKSGWKARYDLSSPSGMPSQAAGTLGIVVAGFGEITRGGVPIPHRFATARDALSKALTKIGLLSKYQYVQEISEDPNQSVMMIVGRKS
jgi:hypothetical protein